MNITPPELDSYLLRITPSRHEVLREMETLARMNDFPIVGPLVGRVLFLYGKLLNAHRILELGSGYGYSAFWWALATPPDAQIICTEGSMENIRAAEQFLSRAGLWHKIVYYHGDALSNMAQIPGEFDIIFMDIDKHQYPQAFLKAFPRLRKGGLFITDNVLWSGRVIDEDPDVATHAIQQYNELIYNTPGAFSAILPLRDGVAVTLKE
ncbi:MAG TPA: O-methyltransferase [Acidobacteriota bacterium]|nr:O-methyltransferase [Acidobacteriota bacterium]